MDSTSILVLGLEIKLLFEGERNHLLPTALKTYTDSEDCPDVEIRELIQNLIRNEEIDIHTREKINIEASNCGLPPLKTGHG
ncbi:hypothetical protein SKAU_G00210380 [Synaphobranchus kaupii]|uniref:Uncharacterized protein n=1 Tax=Synaphobranchus kaupii TaxID=118154 RepID=A0A9Q1F8R0_SYNKA|nr:hypothetical protein SKAU_G00210380 [Synaphobranchus kaupii]